MTVVAGQIVLGCSIRTELHVYVFVYVHNNGMAADSNFVV